MQVKELLEQAHSSPAELAAKLRGALPNENLADVVAAAAGKCKQGSEHADAEHTVEAVHEAAANEQKLERPGAAEASGMPPEGSNNGQQDASQQGGG